MEHKCRGPIDGGNGYLRCIGRITRIHWLPSGIAKSADANRIVWYSTGSPSCLHISLLMLTLEIRELYSISNLDPAKNTGNTLCKCLVVAMVNRITALSTLCCLRNQFTSNLTLFETLNILWSMHVCRYACGIESLYTYEKKKVTPQRRP